MLVLKNVGSNKSIGLIKRVFDLGYDIIQNEMNNLEVDCDTAFNLCVLYYNEFYHSEYNDKNISEYEAMVKFKNNNEVSIEEWLKRIQLMFQICQYYDYILCIDIQTMTIYVEHKGYKYWYNTMSEFASNWIIRLINTNKEIEFKQFNCWTNEDINRLREMAGIKKQTFTNLNFEFYVTDEEIKSGLYIRRYEISDQAIDDCEMDTNDYFIATFKTLDNISFNIFTTHNLYNVYIDKIITYEDGTCDTKEMYNITSDSLKWNTKQDIINYFLGMNY